MPKKYPALRLAILLAAVGLLWPSVGFAEAGDGLRAGDLKLSPSLSLSGTYDGNVYRSAVDASGEPDPIGAPVLGINPALSITTVDPTSVDFTLDGGATWEQYFSDQRRVQRQSGLESDAGISAIINPNGGFSFTLADDFEYTNEAPPFATASTYNRLLNRVGGEFGIHPGDKILDIGLGYKWSAYRYITPTLQDLDKDSHDFNLDLTWKFLPKTAFVLEGDFSLVQYQTTERGFSGSGLENVDSKPLHVKAGLSGLITRRFSTRLLAGYGAGFYDRGASYNGFIGQADLKYEYGNLGLDNHIAAGYKRTFEDSTVGNFFAMHAANLELRQNFLQKRFGFSINGRYVWRDYSDLGFETGPSGFPETVNGRGERVLAPEALNDNYVSAGLGLHSEFLKWWDASLEYNFEGNFSNDQTNVVQSGGQVDFFNSYTRHTVLLKTTIKY